MSEVALASVPADDSPEPGWVDLASLNEILDDIRLALGADTATVLVVDRSRGRLETRARAGIATPVRAMPSIRIGQGFAGRVAQSRQPLLLRKVTWESVEDAALVRHGMSRLLGAPIIVGGELLGVLHVGRKAACDFGAPDVLKLTGLANALGRTLKARFTSESQAAALTLQRSLLPEEIQTRPGLRIAARYIPASGDLGGDWYDVFQLPDGPLVLVMGDVVGHGLEAAVIMGRLRSALRSYALECDDPAEIIWRLDRKICHFEPGALATVVVAMSDAPYDTWRISSAGHFAPLLMVPGAESQPVDIAVDRLIGIDPRGSRRAVEVAVPPGGSLCMFTDGLVERRPVDGRTADELLDRNLALVARALNRSTEPEMACINVLADVVGEGNMDDDLALLVAQRDEATADVDV